MSDNIKPSLFIRGILASLVAVAIIFSFIFVIPWVEKGELAGIRITERTAFEGVWPASTSGFFIKFEGVWLNKFFGGNIKQDVWLESQRQDQIVVKIDREIDVTLISVVPTFMSRVFPQTISYDAKKIIIWVSTDEEKMKWQKWLEAVGEAYLRELRVECQREERQRERREEQWERPLPRKIEPY